MMNYIDDVHQQFAEYFKAPALKPYAYLLSRKGSEGHICLQLDKITEEIENLPESYRKMEISNRALEDSPLVGLNGNDQQPFVVYQERLYLQRYFRYETRLVQRIQGFLLTEKEALPERMRLLKTHQLLISRLFAADTPADDGNDPCDWQLAAAISGVLNDFTIITGGPGTGKTTTVAKILTVLFTIDPALKVALAAPTGKAAARMAESLRNTAIDAEEAIIQKFRQLQPATIHRLLNSVSGSPYFRHNSENPLNYDVVIIDECSMVDLALFAKLLDAIRQGSRVILLGDKDQLASVEAGSLFGDLCQAQEKLNLFSAERRRFINGFISTESRRIPATQERNNDRHPLFQHLVELRRSHRFTGNKGIGKFSKAIIANDIPEIISFFPPAQDEEVVVDSAISEKLFTRFIEKYTAFITEKDIMSALKLLNDQRVLTAVREGPRGLYAINGKIEKLLHDKGLIAANAEFYENRPLILTRNYYEHGLFNGDTGIIRRDGTGRLMAWFEDSAGSLKAVLPGYLTHAETAFAMTIHKSQGSEFGEVLVALPDNTDVLILTRELLYTAVSRAKRKVFVQGSKDVILGAAERFVTRGSGIAGRLRESAAGTY